MKSTVSSFPIIREHLYALSILPAHSIQPNMFLNLATALCFGSNRCVISVK